MKKRLLDYVVLLVVFGALVAALLPVLAVLLVVGALLNSHFLTVSNITGIGQQISALGVVVVGESLILLIGGMDLSL